MTYYNRAFAYSHLGNYNRAVQDFTKAAEINPEITNAFYFYSRGHAFAALGDYSQADGDFSKAVEISPGYADAYLQRALSEGKLGDNLKACADIKRAAMLGDKTAAGLLKKSGTSR